MPKELSGWLEEAVENALRKPTLKLYRDRRVYSLINSIKLRKNLGFNPIIAEYKRRSPSGLYADLDLGLYIGIVKNFVAGLSIITEDKFFGGSYQILREASVFVDRPILMKDIIVSENQIETAYNIGADAVLLILSILTEKEFDKLYSLAKSYGLEILVEVHTLNEAKQAVEYGVEMIGVNSRDLKTLKIDLNEACNVLKELSQNVIRVAESGIWGRVDIERLKNCGADAFLIGTALMKNPKSIMEYV